jgi:hypothetical protein
VIASILDYNYLAYCLMLIPEGFRFLMYTYSWLAPSATFYRRPALITYAKWQLLYCFLNAAVIGISLTRMYTSPLAHSLARTGFLFFDFISL